MHKFMLFAGALFLLQPLSHAYSAPAPPAPPSSVFAATTVNDFLVACRTDQGGCVDEVGTALMDKFNFDGTSGICIQSPDYAQKVPGWLRSHTETRDMPAEDGIYLALKNLYPCVPGAKTAG